MELGGNQVQSTDSGDCVLEINVLMADLDEKQVEQLSPTNWKDVTMDDYDWLYRLLYAEYKEFGKHHCSSKCKIQGLEDKIKGLHNRIK